MSHRIENAAWALIILTCLYLLGHLVVFSARMPVSQPAPAPASPVEI